MKETLIERLVRYTKMNTRSDAYSDTIPSTARQFDLARVLVDECKTMGLTDVEMDQHGIVTATLPSNIAFDVPTIGLIAHMDTADYAAEGVSPRVIENYDGKDIVLNEALNIVSTVEMFPNLKQHVGKTLVVTDGTTLLGADNKAGIANILTAVEYLMAHPEIPHGKIRIAFTIDEEIGTGASVFDVEAFGADFAYTVDGGVLGEMEYETFNAAQADVKISGVSVHPGTAKDTMVNAGILACEYIAQIPAHERPEHTEGYEGFYLLTKMTTDIENAHLEFIIRDHSMAEFESKKALLLSIGDAMNETYGKGTVDVIIEDTYYNMREIIEKDMSIVELASDAMKTLGITPSIAPVRGGTDGSRLSYMGLPTPNLFTGGENFHGRHEFAVVESMEASTMVLVEIARLNTVR